MEFCNLICILNGAGDYKLKFLWQLDVIKINIYLLKSKFCSFFTWPASFSHHLVSLVCHPFTRYILHMLLPYNCRVPELLFQPSMIGVEQAGIVEAMDFLLHKYEQEKQKLLVQVNKHSSVLIM